MPPRVPRPAVTTAALIGLAWACAGPAAAGTQMRYCDPFFLEAQPVRLTTPADAPTRPEDLARAAFLAGLSPERSAAHRGESGPERWQQLSPLGLSANGSNMVVDAAQDRLVLYGVSEFTERVNHVWVRPLAGDSPWSRLEINGPRPPQGTDGATIYDAVRERIVIYGGLNGDGVWALTLSGTPTWSQLAPVDSGPANREGITAVYDRVGDRMIVFGGLGDGYDNDVWAFALGNGSGWTRLEPSGTPPSPRIRYTAIYDSARQRIVFYSGVNFGESPLPPSMPDLWALSLGPLPAWTELHAGGQAPPPLYEAAAAYDPRHDRMAVFSGLLWNFGAMDSAWVLQFGDSLTWTRFAPSVRPAPRRSSCMVYDAERDRFVMFGGGISDTWQLSLSAGPAWTELQPADAGPPLRRWASAAVYDSTRQRTLVVGGQFRYFVHGTPQPIEYPELWSLTTDRFARWSALAAGAAPPGLGGMSLILDPLADRLVMFGGLSPQNGGFGSLWQSPLATGEGWSRLYALGDLPPSRTYHAAVYDPVRHRMFVFGGRAGGELELGDTWMLDLGVRPRWTRLDSTAAAPAPRFGSSAAYDPLGDRIILFGGVTEDSGTFGDTWQLPLAGTPAWSRLSLPASPSPRSFAATTFDSRRQRLVLFGGRDSNGVALHDTWFLPLGGTAGWVQADTSGELPETRWGAAAAYDPDLDRVVVFQGTHDPCGDIVSYALWDTWALYSSDPVPAPLVAARVDAHPGHVSLTWHGPPGAGLSGTVQRRTEASAWAGIGDVHAGTSGLATFVDLTASPGARYAYRLLWSVGSSASTTAPLWVEVPQLRFALARATNPAAQGLAVSLSLPDAAPAKLEVLDVAGRRVASRAVGELGAGDHVVELAAPGALVPGMYLVRLTRGADSRVARVSVVR